MKYTCLGCNKVFNRKENFVRHMNKKIPCMNEKELFLNTYIEMAKNINKLHEKIKEQDLAIKEQNNKIVILQKEIQELRNNSNNIHIGKIDNSTHNNDINILNFGEENLSEILHILKTDPGQVLTDSSSESLVKCLIVIHCSDKFKENHTIKYDDKKQKYLQIHKNGKWSYKKPRYIVKNTPICHEAEKLFDRNPDKYLNFLNSKDSDIRKLISMNFSNGMPITSYNLENIEEASKKLLQHYQKKL